MSSTKFIYSPPIQYISNIDKFIPYNSHHLILNFIMDYHNAWSTMDYENYSYRFLWLLFEM